MKKLHQVYVKLYKKITRLLQGHLFFNSAECKNKQTPLIHLIWYTHLPSLNPLLRICGYCTSIDQHVNVNRIYLKYVGNISKHFPPICRIDKIKTAKVRAVFGLILHKINATFSYLGDAMSSSSSGYTGMLVQREISGELEAIFVEKRW